MKITRSLSKRRDPLGRTEIFLRLTIDRSRQHRLRSGVFVRPECWNGECIAAPRRCELMFDQYHRYWDLIRWHKLDLLDTGLHPNIVLGANVSTATAEQLKDVAVSNGYINGATNGSVTGTRVFTDREYLQPLGTTLIGLYNAKGLELLNNPGW